jgi:glycosyltransferase involved in cell wall biosynthesis
MHSFLVHLSFSSTLGRHTFEILIVDDGSSEHAAAVALELTAERHTEADIRVMRLEFHHGKSSAVRCGMLHVR